MWSSDGHFFEQRYGPVKSGGSLGQQSDLRFSSAQSEGMHSGSVCLSVHMPAYFSSRTVARMLIRFFLCFMPLKTTSNSFFLISFSQYYQHDRRTNLWQKRDT
jgi:hypothetical protein